MEQNEDTVYNVFPSLKIVQLRAYIVSSRKDSSTMWKKDNFIYKWD